MQASIRSASGATPRPDGRVLRLKILGLMCCAGPLVLLLMFALGEGMIEEGWGHLLQAAPLVALVIIAWWRPLVGGALITIAATVLAVIYAVTTVEQAWWLPTVAMFFVPAVVGGALFAAAGVIARGTGGRDTVAG